MTLQAQITAYNDFKLLVIVCLAAMPLLIIFKGSKPQEDEGGHPCWDGVERLSR